MRLAQLLLRSPLAELHLLTLLSCVPGGTTPSGARCILCMQKECGTYGYIVFPDQKLNLKVKIKKKKKAVGRTLGSYTTGLWEWLVD